MKKNKKKQFSSILKKGSQTSLIGLLLFLFLKIGTSFLEAPVLPGTHAPIELYSNQTNDDLTTLYVSAINEAKESIYCVIYSFKDLKLLFALKEKSDHGIPVYIVCDAKASPGLIHKLPQAKIVSRAGPGLTHQKILIVDHKQIFLGTANFTHESLAVHGNLVIGVENPTLADLMISKIISMDEYGNSNPLKHQKTMAGNQHVELWMLPDDPQAPKRIIELIRSAKKTIYVAMFTWTRQDFTHELINASLRGVKVEAVLDRFSGKGASSKIVALFNQSNVPMRLSTGKGLLHYKFALIDDEILINGSANWTNAAFKTNDDCFMVIYPLTAPQQDKMRSLWQTIYSQSVAST